MSLGKILVIRGGAIGDFILTLPVLSALREQFPQAHLELLGYPHIAALAQSGGLVDAMRSIEARPLAGFFARNGVLDPSLGEYFASFAIIISYLYDPDRVFEENVKRCAPKAQFIAGPHKPDDRLNLHATELFLKPLERLAIFAPDSTPRLSIVARHLTADSPSPLKGERAGLPAEGSAKVGVRDGAVREAHFSPTSVSGHHIAIHPGSGSERKNWPETKWSETIALLLQNPETKILLIGGEAEGDRLIRLSLPCPPDRIELVQNQPLVEVARRLSGCGAFVGHDSGISHLAAALGLPTIVLWGASAEAVWRPKGDHVVVLKSEAGLSNISPAIVIKTLERIVFDQTQSQCPP